VARARDRDALRVFRVDRMRDAVLLTGKDARFTVPDGFTVRTYLGRAPWELSDAPATHVRVRFAFPESRWVLARAAGTAVEPLLEDGGALIEFAVRDRNPFLRWLLTFGRKVEVVTPEDVTRELGAMRRKVAALYAEATA
jgi:predicted DNA-binding transcriptional regulator YafY